MYINQIRAQAYIQHKGLIEISDRYGANQWPYACCLVLIYDYFQWGRPVISAKIKNIVSSNQFFKTENCPTFIKVNVSSILISLNSDIELYKENDNFFYTR